MRSEKDIIRNIIEYAESDEDIRAVIRTDLVPVRDYLYSYNFCFIVSRISKYEDDSIRQSCDSVVEIWHIVGNKVADLCRYEYPRQEEADMREFIQNLVNQKAQEQKKRTKRKISKRFNL